MPESRRVYSAYGNAASRRFATETRFVGSHPVPGTALVAVKSSPSSCSARLRSVIASRDMTARVRPSSRYPRTFSTYHVRPPGVSQGYSCVKCWPSPASAFRIPLAIALASARSLPVALSHNAR